MHIIPTVAAPTPKTIHITFREVTFLKILFLSASHPGKEATFQGGMLV